MTQLCLLADRGFLKVSGIDAVKFMQGYTTCDLTALVDETAQLGAVCTIKGRMLTSFLVIKRGNDLTFRMHRSMVAPTIEFLKKYIVFSKAELQDISDELVCYGAPGSEHQSDVDAEFCAQLPNRVEYWVATDIQVSADSDSAVFLQAEFDDGIAWVSAPVAEEFLPQMFNYHQRNGVDFEKGCYLGQEIVARAHYRGELKRRLHQLSSATTRQAGDKLNEGVVVASNGHDLLAVIQNPDQPTVGVTFEDGETVEATPVDAG